MAAAYFNPRLPMQCHSLDGLIYRLFGAMDCQADQVQIVRPFGKEHLPIGFIMPG